jgi:hypothetical protein
MEKKRVLLNWFEVPGRPELQSVFKDISDKIEFIHLYHRKPEDRIEANSPFPMIYWFDYTSPGEMLDKIKPDKIITMEAEDLLAISLIVAARSRGIPTFAMQHGFVPDSISEIFIPLNREPITGKGTIKRYTKLFSFFIKSIKPFSIRRFIQYCRYMNTYFRKGSATAAKKFPYEWRKPDYYLCFSKFSGRHYKNRDKVSDARLLELGVPVFDSFFRQLSEKGSYINNGTTRPYYLLIDTSFGEYKDIVPLTTIYRCYRNLAEYCARHNAILKIKLHPWNYDSPDFTDTEDIRFYRKLPAKELNDLIFGARACFGFFSTLTIPVVTVKKLCQVTYDGVCFKELIDQGITPVVDFFNFEAKDIVLDEFEVNEVNLAEFTKKYLYKTDGKASERLFSILSAN